MEDSNITATQDTLIVGRFEYRRRPYTPKRPGHEPGHGWVRKQGGHVAEVGQEVRVLLDEIDRLRALNGSFRKEQDGS